MSSNYSSNRDSSSRGGRPRSGGGRRRSSDSRGPRNNEDRPRREHVPIAPAKKQGFFAKILSVFRYRQEGTRQVGQA